MSRLAPTASSAEQLRLARGLGLVPLRQRGRRGGSAADGSPAPSVALAAGLSLQRLAEDRLWQAILAATGLQIEAVRAHTGESGRALLSVGLGTGSAQLDLPEPRQLRGDAAAKRALWPQLRRLRRERLGG